MHIFWGVVPEVYLEVLGSYNLGYIKIYIQIGGMITSISLIWDLWPSGSENPSLGANRFPHRYFGPGLGIARLHQPRS